MPDAKESIDSHKATVQWVSNRQMGQSDVRLNENSRTPVIALLCVYDENNIV